MTRVARLDAVGVCHHVVVRGIERRTIFHDDVDRSDFVSRLRRQLIEGSGSCLAWVLMTNHVHLVMRTGVRPLSNVMQRLNGGYARAFNLRHGRVGYLFEDRFRSFLVDDDAYLRVLIRYVHLNPLRAGMVESVEALARYPWGGHSELMGRAGVGVIARTQVFAQFGMTLGEARGALGAWMSAAQPSNGKSDPPVREICQSETAPLDTGELRSRIRWEPSGLLEPTIAEVRANQLRASGWTLDNLINWVCLRLGADPISVRGGRRTLRESRARAVIAALGTSDLRLQLEQVARATGVTASAVCRSVARGTRDVSAMRIQLSEAGPPRSIRPLRREDLPSPAAL